MNYIKKLSDSHKGQKAWNKGMIFKKLKNCQRQVCYNLMIKENHLKYCSKECYSIDRSENNPTKRKEIRQKISLSHKGKMAWNKGKIGIYTEETINKIRLARSEQVFSEESKMKKSESLKKLWQKPEFRNKIIKSINGEKSFLWQGGISFEPYGLGFNNELKRFIKQRDLNICQTPNCMEIENLCIHHIDYDKKNSNQDNLITLCRRCHSKTNFGRGYWEEYYNEIINIYI